MALTNTDLERRYLSYQFLRSFIFVAVIWLLYYRMFMTDQRVGVLDALSFGFGLLAEIPSGALADRFGRKRLTMLGCIIGGLGMMLQGIAFGHHGYLIILTGQVIVSAGWAMSSGADDALFYDNLKYDEESGAWKKLASRGNQMKLLATLISYPIGGLLYSLSPRLPFLAFGITATAALTLISVPEIKHATVDTGHKIKDHLADLKDGVNQIIRKDIIGYLPIILIVQGLYYTFGYGLLRPLLQIRFGFGANASSWLLFAIGVVAYALLHIQTRLIDRVSEKANISVIVLPAIVALLASLLPLGHAGFLVILVFYVGEYLLDPLISNGLNKHISPRHRATALSAASFLKSLPYVLVAPLIGYLSIRHEVNSYLFVMALLSSAALLVYLFSVRDKPLKS